MARGGVAALLLLAASAAGQRPGGGALVGKAKVIGVVVESCTG